MFRNRYSKRMRLYHGSDQIVEKPRILEPNRRMDFGKGFYTTQSYKQAERWARDVRRKRGADHAYVSEYEYNESGRLRVLVFDGPTEEWLDFVETNRLKGDLHDYDIVIGPVADEGVYYVLLLYESGAISSEETIIRLEAARLDGQVLFHTDKSLDDIVFMGFKEVERRSLRNGC